jgi:hypothetical protein
VNVKVAAEQVRLSPVQVELWRSSTVTGWEPNDPSSHLEVSEVLAHDPANNPIERIKLLRQLDLLPSELAYRYL